MRIRVEKSDFDLLPATVLFGSEGRDLRDMRENLDSCSLD